MSDDKIPKQLTPEQANKFCTWLQDELVAKEKQIGTLKICLQAADKVIAQVELLARLEINEDIDAANITEEMFKQLALYEAIK